MSSIMDEILQGAAERSKDFSGVLKIKSGEKIVIRFLMEGSNGLKIMVHGRFLQTDQNAGYTVPCAKQYGKECPYCDLVFETDDGRSNLNHFCWLVWNHSIGKLQVFFFKNNKASPLQQLAESFSDNETIVSHDFSLKREGEGMTTKYTLSLLTRAPQPLPAEAKVPTKVELQHKMIREMLAKAFCPDLLTDKPITVKQQVKSVDTMLDPSYEDPDDDLLPGGK